MTLARWILVIAVAGIVCWHARDAVAQANRLLPTDDAAYGTIERLQRRGHLLELNPTAIPYRFGEIARAVALAEDRRLNSLERRWLDLLGRRLHLDEWYQDEHRRSHSSRSGDRRDTAKSKSGRSVPRTGRSDTESTDSALFTGGAEFVIGSRFTDHQTLEPIRPYSDSLRAYPWATLRLWLDAGPAIAEIGPRSDFFYNDDPMGLDVALRLGARSDNSYVGVNTRYASAYLGRFRQHWSLPGSDGVFISNNPLSYDQIAVRLGVERLSVRMILGELDSVTEDGRFTGRVADSNELSGNLRRFLSAHRWDWRPTKRFSMAFMESAIYSDENSGLSIKYLNPVHPFIFLIDNRPKNDENNGFVGGLLWLQTGRWTWHGQIAMDDFDALNLNERTSFALNGSVVRAGGRVDAGGTLTMVATRTYNTDQPPGRYMYLLGGIGTQFSDYIQAGVFADVYADDLLVGLQVTPRVDVLAQGEIDFRDDVLVSRADFGTILEGTVERTVRPSLRLFYQSSPWWWVRADGGVNFTDNVENVEGASETRFAGMLSFGVTLTIQRSAYDW